MERVSRLNRDLTWRELSVVVADDNGMQRFNAQYLSRPHPTDVISVAYPPVPGEAPGMVGEIMVNAERALRGPRPSRWSPARELALYIGHGCDHLSGADDATPLDRQRMRRRELSWLKQAQVRGITLELIEA